MLVIVHAARLLVVKRLAAKQPSLGHCHEWPKRLLGTLLLRGKGEEEDRVLTFSVYETCWLSACGSKLLANYLVMATGHWLAASQGGVDGRHAASTYHICGCVWEKRIG